MSAPNSVDEDIKSQELAFLYVNITGYNARKAYKMWCDEHNVDYTTSSLSNSCRYFAKPAIKKYIKQFQAENRERYSNMRDINIQNLYSISTDLGESTSNRIAATKELNSMFGYNSQNINVDANAAIEIVIE